MPKPNVPIETLLADLHHPDFLTRCNAARQLGQTRDPRAVDALLPDLNDPDWRVRRNATQALGVARDRRAVEPLIQALHDRSLTVRRRAAVALGRIKDERAIVPLLKSLLTTDNWQVYRHTFQAVRKFGAASIPAITTALQEAAPPQRHKLMSLLGAIGHTDALDAMLQALRDSDPLVRWRAVCTLGQIGDKRAIEPLLAALSDPNIQTQSMVVRALGQLGASQAVTPLLQLLHDHELYGDYSDLYRAITETLQRLSGMPPHFGGIVRNELPALMSFMNEQYPQMLTTMLDTLRKGLTTFANILANMRKTSGETPLPATDMLASTNLFGGSKTTARQDVETLMGWLKADSSLTRVSAAVSLPWYWDARALEPLRQAMYDPDVNVQMAATWALGALEKTLMYKQQLAPS